MTPYYRTPDLTVYHADALDLLRSLPDDSVQLVATDPPYFRVKNEDWDRAWKNERAFLLWMRDLCREWRRVLAPNGSLYVFASPQMAHGVERVIRRHFRVLNAITWVKDEGWHKKAEKEAQLSLSSPWERAVFAEQNVGDPNPIAGELRRARTAAGSTCDAVERALGYLDNRGRGSRLAYRWETGSSLPSPEDYAAAMRFWGDRRGDAELLHEYMGLRRAFHATADNPYADVWDFPTVSAYPGKHPTEKPLAMMEHIVRLSSRPGDTVLDTFSGSGTTARAALNLGRTAIVGDNDRHWCDWTVNRCAQQTLNLNDAA